jgi:antirestriction protein ArdC
VKNKNSRKRQKRNKNMEFSSNSHSNPASSLPSPVATLRADGKPNTQAIIAANVQHLIAQLEAGHSEVLTQYLTTMARFHKYSLGNVLLIASQKPEASNVAGIFTWNQLGRKVKKGEKGIMIFAPMVAKKRRQKESPEREEPDSKTTAAPALVGFRPVYVWDISQTEGKELPALREFSGEAGTHLAQLVQFVIGHGIKFGYSDQIAPARGVSKGGSIELLPDMTEAEQFATLVHEVAHELLHKSERRSLITKTVRETEAEAVAFVVSKAIGLETGSASADYIQLYHGDAKLLAESLEIVQKTAAVILGALSPEETPASAAA